MFQCTCNVPQVFRLYTSYTIRRCPTAWKRPVDKSDMSNNVIFYSLWFHAQHVRIDGFLVVVMTRHRGTAAVITRKHVWRTQVFRVFVHL